jgi:Ca2+-binding EF-hand superfamily protein
MNDRQGTGKLTYEDFIRCLQIASMNATQREIDVLIKELDSKE